eukprot:CAMPEP_0181361132 /NCGR_PEP_ID=MMETSP1106-20121128/7102_1 /TAXON_ID=81844 /ORGANISM="Mantoniella antarctica, Strain SL-175" /LENGTH=379 /DNA_ID=CAMNT_0023474583 /DNA_START=477 /DNA_END=1613 /DNA_ORIENTATION=-
MLRAFAIGESVEARRNSSFEDCDVLYYEAKVTAVHRLLPPVTSTILDVDDDDGHSATHYDLAFEDDSSQALVPRAWVMANSRRVVAERGHARVITGHADLHHRGGEGRQDVLLMVFTECPTLYQSAVAVVVTSPSSSPSHALEEGIQLDHTVLPFEQHQCFSLIVALAGGKGRAAVVSAAADATVSTPAAVGSPGVSGGGGASPCPSLFLRPLSLAVLGGGGCALPTALRAVFGSALDIDVVELDADVAAMARAHFGATDSLHFRLCEGEAAAFLRGTPDATLDAVVLDVASSGADAHADNDEDGIVLPPKEFVSEPFLLGTLARCLAPGGACVVNVIGGRAALRRVAANFQRCFSGGAAVLCTDPNYLFWGFKGDGGW